MKKPFLCRIGLHDWSYIFVAPYNDLVCLKCGKKADDNKKGEEKDRIEKITAEDIWNI